IFLNVTEVEKLDLRRLHRAHCRTQGQDVIAGMGFRIRRSNLKTTNIVVRLSPAFTQPDDTHCLMKSRTAQIPLGILDEVALWRAVDQSEENVLDGILRIVPVTRHSVRRVVHEFVVFPKQRLDFLPERIRAFLLSWSHVCFSPLLT